MPLAYTIAPGKGDTDALMHAVARRLMEVGVRTCGTVQINTDCASGGPCDMDVKVLPDGPMLRISQTLGRGARGCRLDPDTLEQAVAWCEPRLVSADFVIVNKFGKHEANGRGFRNLIAEAMVQDLPVLVGLNSLNLAAFTDFTGGAAKEIAPDLAALEAWAMSVTRVKAPT